DQPVGAIVRVHTELVAALVHAARLEVSQGPLGALEAEAKLNFVVAANPVVGNLRGGAHPARVLVVPGADAVLNHAWVVGRDAIADGERADLEAAERRWEDARHLHGDLHPRTGDAARLVVLVAVLVGPHGSDVVGVLELARAAQRIVEAVNGGDFAN